MFQRLLGRDFLSEQTSDDYADVRQMVHLLRLLVEARYGKASSEGWLEYFGKIRVEWGVTGWPSLRLGE